MKTILSLLLLLPLHFSSASEEDAFPIEFNGMFDGGTLYIKDIRKASPESVTLCLDRRSNTKTYEKVYLGAIHPTLPGARLATPDEAEAKFKAIEAMLRAFFGNKLFAQIATVNTQEKLDLARKQNPQFDGSNISDACFACQLIKTARKSTPKAEQSGADQPATQPADKGPAKDQPSTPTSKTGPR